MSTTILPTLPAKVQQQVEQHAFSETRREVGGVLVGHLTADGASISGFVPALRAAGAATHLTFTHEVWADTLDVVERDHPGRQIVGWYHTHPSHGLFLSEYDLFIHRNFFADPRMLALVIDPVAGQMGWFGWRGEEIAELGRANTLRPAVEHAADTEARASVRRSRRGRTGLAIAGAVLALGAGAALAGTVAAGSQDDELAMAAERIVTLEDRLDELDHELRSSERAVAALTEALHEASTHSTGSTNALVVTVQRGDSWWDLADRFYGDGSRHAELADANAEIDQLEPGDRVRIPNPDLVSPG